MITGVKNVKSGFALPTVLISSIVMLMVLLTAVVSTVAVRTALLNQYYGQMAQVAGESGLVYAKACLTQSGGIAGWSDAKPLKPNTDCSGNEIVACPTAGANVKCYVSNTGNAYSRFSIKAPVLDSSGDASVLPNSGFVELVRESNGATWRTYTAPASQPTQVPNLCSGHTNTTDGWANAVEYTGVGSVSGFEDPNPKFISSVNAVLAPGTQFFRRDFSIAEDGTYNIKITADDLGVLYIDGKQVMTASLSNVVDSGTTDLSYGCHVATFKLVNTGILNNPTKFKLAVMKNGGSDDVLVSDTSWRWSAGSQVGFSAINYYQSSSWTVARDLGAAAPSSANVMVVAGGGGGGGTGSGGGGGGYLYSSSFLIPSPSYTVTVGGGGAGGVSTLNGGKGGNSIFSTLTAEGGGVGVSHGGNAGGSGGSGGGGSITTTVGPVAAGGTGSQGNSGGTGYIDSGWAGTSGGGGGAGVAGSNGCNSPGCGKGGNGLANSITGASVTYAGGGGAGEVMSGYVGAGGSGGGGSGIVDTAGTNGVANTGGGGGGGSYNGSYWNGGNGGSGVVIVSYPTSLIQATGGTITISGGNTIHTFTSSGTFANVWASTSGNSTARMISTTHSYDGSGNYPSSSYAMFRDWRNITVAAPTEVRLSYACDDSCDIYLDGNKVGSGGISDVYTTILTLTEGTHKFGVTLGNGTGPSAFAFAAVRTSDNVSLSESDSTWTATNAWYATSTSPMSFDNSYRPTPVTDRNVNIAPSFSQWTFTGGASYSSSTGILTLPPAGSATSPRIPVDRPSLISNSGDFYATQPSTNAGITPNAAYHSGISYFAADGITPVYNTANYTSNGCAQSFSPSVWALGTKICNFAGGADVVYIEYRYYGSNSGYASPDLIIKNPTLVLSG